MSTARISEDVIAERHRLGLDKTDEMWEGVLHVVPPPSYDHQRLSGRMFAVLLPLAEAAGYEVLFEAGLFDPVVVASTNYRVPDLVVFEPTAASARGVEGSAVLVIEIASPGDDSYAKVPFYSSVGAAEVLIVERDRTSVRRWSRLSGGLVEQSAGHGGWHHLDALAMAVRGADGVLEVDVGGPVHRV